MSDKTVRLATPNLRLRLVNGRLTIGVIAAAIVVYLVTLVVVPQFATADHFTSLVNVASILGILAIGQGIVILGGGIDLSVANVATTSGVLASSLTAAGVSTPAIIAVSLTFGLLVGLVNGSTIAVLDVPPLVITLAVGSVIQGVQLMTTGGTPNSAAPAALQQFANGRLVLGLSGSSVVWILLTIATALFLARWSVGRGIYAVGSNRRVAELSGLPVRGIQTWTYVVAGVMAATAGLLLLGYTGISSSTIGDPYLLPAIAAVVLGGTSILGGQGSAVAIAGGVFLLTSVESLLAVINVPSAVRQILEGMILLAVLAFYSGRIPLPRRSRAPRRSVGH